MHLCMAYKLMNEDEVKALLQVNRTATRNSVYEHLNEFAKCRVKAS